MFRSEVLSIRPFRNLWLGQSISQLGDSFYFVVFCYMTLKITGSNAMVGFVGAAEAAPYFLLSPYAGVLADRIDRRKIMLASDVASATILIAFAIIIVSTGHTPVWSIFAVAILLSSVRSFFMPAKSAAIPNLVPSELVVKATALSLTTFNVMQVMGLAVTASVMAALFAASPKWFFAMCVVLNAISFLASAFFVAKLPSIVPDRDDHRDVSPISDLRIGLGYLTSRRDLSVLLVLSSCMTLFIAPFFVVYLAANKAWFGNLPSSIAWSEFSFFLGMIVGSSLVGRMKVTRPGLGFAFGIAVCGLFVAFMAGSRYLPEFLCCNLVAGISVPFAQIPVAAYLQTSVPDALRGRVNSAMTIATLGIQPLGIGFGGLLVQKLGIVASFLVMGIGMGIVALAGLLDSAFRQARLPSSDSSETCRIDLEPAV